MKDFKAEYEKLHRTLEKSHEGEQRLIKKAKELMNDINENQHSIARAQKEEEEFAANKKKLQDDIERAWSTVESMHEKEAEKRSQITEIKLSIEQLKVDISSGPGWTKEQEEAITELRNTRNHAQRELDEKNASLMSLRAVNSELEGQVDEETSLRTAMDAEIANYKEQVATKRAEAEHEQRRKDRLDADLRALKSRVEIAQREKDTKQKSISDGTRNIAEQERKKKDSQDQMERYLKDYDALFQRTHKLTEHLDEQVRWLPLVWGGW